VEFGIIGGYFLFFDKKVVYRLKNLFDKCGYMVKNYLKYSVPVIISDLLLGLGNNVTSMIIGRLGASFVSANAIMAMIVRLSTVFNQGISNASGTITGNTLGEGKADVAYKQSWLFLWMSVIVGILAAGIVLGASPFIISAYNITAETREIAYQLMYAVAIMVVFQTMQGVTTKGVLRGGGDTKFLLVADVLFLWVVSLPLGFLTAFVWNASPFIIYVALKLDWAIKSFWCIGRMKSRKWMKKIAVS
ncbi:MAG: MATE family efflux transporter, partial [Clostridia bacterium]|nr:MATE family efflux transporter [Clostridia bacterium]